MIHLWTDGCCLRNPGGPGGWAYLIVDEDEEIIGEAHGGERVSTNNRMELKAVIEALAFVEKWYPEDEVTVVSDSLYVVKGVNEWRHKWKKNGWRLGKNGKGKPVKNFELWKQLDALAGEHVFLWVKGHSGVELNEYADELALKGAQRHG